MTDERYGASAPYSLGIEEELMIVDPSTCDQVPAVSRLLGHVVVAGLKTELFASIVETNTPPLEHVGLAEGTLRALRRVAREAAQAEGLTVAAAGTHPFADPEGQAIVDEKRYASLAGYGGVSVRRQGVQGLHVHVGMPSREACWSCLELVLPWLPVVLALSANSPWFCGERTGMASNRASVLAELPRSGAPPAFASYDEWEAWLARLVRFGIAEDHTRLWWDVRPQPTFGTLEVRIPDQPTGVLVSAALAALVQALCATALAGGLPERSELLADRGRADYAQNRWAAARFGPRAELLHPDGRSVATAAELAAELLELVAPAARRLGGDALLARLDPEACEADLQLHFTTAQEAAADLLVRSLD